jgi:hypothetical protein
MLRPTRGGCPHRSRLGRVSRAAHCVQNVSGDRFVPSVQSQDIPAPTRAPLILRLVWVRWRNQSHRLDLPANALLPITFAPLDFSTSPYKFLEYPSITSASICLRVFYIQDVSIHGWQPAGVTSRPQLTSVGIQGQGRDPALGADPQPVALYPHTVVRLAPPLGSSLPPVTIPRVSTHNI